MNQFFSVAKQLAWNSKWLHFVFVTSMLVSISLSHLFSFVSSKEEKFQCTHGNKIGHSYFLDMYVFLYLLLHYISIHTPVFLYFFIYFLTRQAYNYIYVCILDYVQYFIDMCGEIIICLNYNNFWVVLCASMCLRVIKPFQW